MNIFILLAWALAMVATVVAVLERSVYRILIGATLALWLTSIVFSGVGAFK